MEKVTVTAISNHVGSIGMIKTGQQYETTPQHAAELKRNGLVEYEGPAAKKVEGEKINVSAKSSNQTTTAIIEQKEEDQGKLIPASKEKLEKGESKEKVEVKPEKEKVVKKK